MFEQGFDQSVTNAVENGFTIPSLVGLGVSGGALLAYKGVKALKNRNQVNKTRVRTSEFADQIVDFTTNLSKKNNV